MTDWSGWPLITIDNDEEHSVDQYKIVHAQAHVDTLLAFVSAGVKSILGLRFAQIGLRSKRRG